MSIWIELLHQQRERQISYINIRLALKMSSKMTENVVAMPWMRYLYYYKAVDFCLEPLSRAGRMSQIEPSGIIKLSTQSSGFEAHEEIEICSIKGELWRREPYGEERS